MTNGSKPATPIEGHWPFLDLIRFSAALLVLFGHARGLLLEGIGSVERPNVLIQALYFLSGLQHEGVVLFFIVSGFLVGGSAWRLIATERFQYAPYLINRFARIYLVYIPALVLVLVLDQIGKQYFLDTRFYGVRPLFPAAVFDEWTWAQVPCHLATLQGIICNAWGADPPLWSLGYEWAFYLIAPLVLFPLLVSKWRRAVDLVVPAVIVVALTWWNTEWLLWFAMWMCGAFAARAFEAKSVSTSVGILGAALCAAGLVLSRLKLGPLIATDVMVTLGLATAISSRGLMKLGGEIALIRRGAGFSYSLYLIHLPVCLFIGALYQRWLAWPAQLVQPDARGLAGFAGMVAIALLVALLFAMATEDHTTAVRRWLSRMLLKRAR
jgi:peptidoglycan/LPS O-acetylase OafA/YrhL